MEDWKLNRSKYEKDRLMREMWGDAPPRYLWFAILSPRPSELSRDELALLRTVFFGGREPDFGAIELSMYTDGPTKDGVHGDLRIRGFTSPVYFVLTTMDGEEMPLMRVADPTNTQPIHFRPAA